MTAAVSADLLQASFEKKRVQVDDVAASRCSRMCTEYELSVGEFMDLYEAFTLNHADLDASSISDQAVDLLESFVRKQRNKTASAKKTPSQFVVSNGVKSQHFDKNSINKLKARPSSDVFGGLEVALSASVAAKDFRSPPPKKKMKQEDTNGMSFSAAAFSPAIMPTPGSNEKFANRDNKGQVVCTFNEQIEAMDGVTSQCDCLVELSPDLMLSKPYKFMYTTLVDKVDSMEHRLRDMEKLITEQNGLPAAAKMGLPNQESVFVVGRVCCETLQGKINDKSILLEGSRESSNGARVQLDVAEIQDFGLFPGQVIGVEGMNSTGRRMIATKIYQGVALDYAKTLPQEILEIESDLSNNQPVSVLVASGPYTTNDGLDFAPFAELMCVIKETKPQVLIMIGPFIDSAHPVIKSEDGLRRTVNGRDIFMTPLELFQRTFTPLLEETLQEVNTKVVFIPSHRDIVHMFPLPQPPMAASMLSFYDSDNLLRTCTAFERDQIYLASNPCTIQINKLHFSVISADILKHLGAEETSKQQRPAGAPSNRFERLMEHLIQQKSLYPLFPISTDVAIDLSQLQHMELQNCPDVLICPSELLYFAKRVRDTIGINPGPLAKGLSAGTYAKVTVMPMSQEDLGDLKSTEPIPHKAPNRVRVDVVRI